MKIFKSHFWYSKSQRNGIFLLVIIIIILQVVIFINPFSGDDLIAQNNPEVIAFQKQIDSLKLVELENKKPKIYPFNPNYITDYRGEQLGMSLEEIERLLAFRKTGKFVNSDKEFQQVTKVSDSLLNAISPFFKFPDWVVARNKRNSDVISSTVEISREKSQFKKSKYNLTTTDINKATAEDLQTISGIGPGISKRIINYRSKLQGFSFSSQLYEVWGLEKEVADRVLATFKIIDKPIIKKININTASFKEVLKNPYIDYELCKKIFDYRDEVAEIQNIEELKNIQGFPLEKYNRIVLYLLAE